MLTESVVLLAIGVVCLIAYYDRIIRHEEIRLAELFGAEFESYRQRVPPLVSALSRICRGRAVARVPADLYAVLA